MLGAVSCTHPPDGNCQRHSSLCDADIVQQQSCPLCCSCHPTLPPLRRPTLIRGAPSPAVNPQSTTDNKQPTIGNRQQVTSNRQLLHQAAYECGVHRIAATRWGLPRHSVVGAHPEIAPNHVVVALLCHKSRGSCMSLMLTPRPYGNSSDCEC